MPPEALFVNEVLEFNDLYPLIHKMTRLQVYGMQASFFCLLSLDRRAEAIYILD